MKSNFFCVLGLTALVFSSLSCNKDGESELLPATSVTSDNPLTRSSNPNQTFEVIDGCLKFQNTDDYVSMYVSLAGKDKDQLLSWSDENKYNSLLKKYEIEDANTLPELKYDEETAEQQGRLPDMKLATLLNNKGIVWVGDTILKLRGEYIYAIANSDFSKVTEIDNAANITDLDYIPHFKHTLELKSVYRNADRSGVIGINSRRREFVEFYGKATRIGEFQLIVKTYMIGKAQKKTMFWWPPFDDNIVSGTVSLDAGEAIYGDQKFAIRPSSVTAYNRVRIDNIPFLIQFFPNPPMIKIQVTYKFVKNSARAEQSYTNIYNLTIR